MKAILIHKAKIINEGNSFKGSLLIEGDKISKIFRNDVPENILNSSEVIDAEDKWVIPGVIDTHVHFREPGLTNKADFYTESKASTHFTVCWPDLGRGPSHIPGQNKPRMGRQRKQTWRRW